MNTSSSNNQDSVDAEQRRAIRAVVEELTATVEEVRSDGISFRVENLDSESEYRVEVDRDGAIESCSCPDWEYRVVDPGSDLSLCKHTILVQNYEDVLVDPLLEEIERGILSDGGSR